MSDTVTPVSLRPGEARCPGPSTRDLILGDSTPPPAQLLVESYEFEGDADVPYEEFTSPSYAAAEHEHMWSRTWQWACREEHIPEPGDYYVYDVGDRSAIVVRGPDGTVRAFHNACLHRGTQLKPPATAGYSPKLRCPFHGWTWDLDGELIDLPCEWDFPHVDDRGVPPPPAAHRAVGWVHLRQLRRLPCRVDGSATGGVPRCAPGTLRQLEPRRSLRRGAHPQAPPRQLEGVCRSVPRGVPHPRNALAVHLHRRRRQRPVRRVRRQRLAVRAHDRHHQPARPRGQAPGRAGHLEHAHVPQEPGPGRTDDPRG